LLSHPGHRLFFLRLGLNTDHLDLLASDLPRTQERTSSTTADRRSDISLHQQVTHGVLSLLTSHHAPHFFDTECSMLLVKQTNRSV
jgi:hypothetical protein